MYIKSGARKNRTVTVRMATFKTDILSIEGSSHLKASRDAAQEIWAVLEMACRRAG